MFETSQREAGCDAWKAPKYVSAGALPRAPLGELTTFPLVCWEGKPLFSSSHSHFLAVAALHQGAPGQMTWLGDPPPWHDDLAGSRAGLTIVPVVPWEGALRRQGPPTNCHFLSRCFDV